MFTTYKNTKIHYTDSGKGSVVVLLHGFLEDHSMWNTLAEELSKRYRVFAFDLLGHGKSESMGYIHTMEDQADMIFSVLQENKIRKVSLIGHSMGGYIALAFAELYPDCVKKLSLVNSTAKPDSPERQANRDRAIAAVKQNHDIFVRMAISNLFAPKYAENLTQEIETVKAIAAKTPLQGIIAALEGMKIRNDREVMLHFAPYPIQMILGQNDPVLDYADTKATTHDTQVELVTLDGGHMSHLENTSELMAALQQFLKK